MTKRYYGVRWIAFDGEAIDGKYILLVDSTGQSIANDDGISTAECLRFVARRLPRSAGWRRCMFGMTFDIHHWIRDLPKEARIEFLRGEMVTFKDGDEGWSLQWIGQRILTITPHGKKTDTIRIWDAYHWFATSFIRACETWGIEVPPIIHMGKALREDLSKWKEDGRLVEYSVLECQKLTELMALLAEAVEEMPGSPKLNNWHGPGALAAHYLRKVGARKQMRDFSGAHIGPEMFDAFARAFHGGRIEQRIAGTVEPVYRYDLRSAYSWAAWHLGPVGYQWLPVEKWDGEPWAKMSVWRVSWDVPDSAPFGPLPWRRGRDTGYSISYPQRGEGWYWWPEVKAALVTWGARHVKVHEGYVCRRGDRETTLQPLLRALDRDRQRWAGDAREDLYKRAMVAIYGRICQRRGRDGWPGFFYCLPWAGWITSCVRAALLNAVRGNEDVVIAFTTDGVLTTRELPLTLNPAKLGGWRVEKFREGTFLLPGLYRLYRDDFSQVEEKTRGFERAQVAWGHIIDQLNTGKRGTVTVRRFVGHGLADHWPDKFAEHRLQFRNFRIHIDPFVQSSKRAGSRALLRASAAGEFDWSKQSSVLGILPGDEHLRISARAKLPNAWESRAETWDWEDSDERIDRRTEALEWKDTLEDWEREERAVDRL
jgi:hypothetical protein